MRTVAKHRWFRGWLAGMVVLAAGCIRFWDSKAEDVTPIDLVMENRVVLTPGHEIELKVEIRREQPKSSHPVELVLSGG